MNVYGILYFAGIVASVTCACPNGWTRHGSSCYHFSHDNEDWPGALTMCATIGGTLVEVNGPEENMYLTSQVGAQKGPYWIALSDVVIEGYWQWMVSKNMIEKDDYSNWASGEPNNDDKDENCGEIYPSGQWNDAECNYPHKYICEKSDEFVDFRLDSMYTFDSIFVNHLEFHI